jgi:hypothetical protein
MLFRVLPEDQYDFGYCPKHGRRRLRCGLDQPAFGGDLFDDHAVLFGAAFRGVVLAKQHVAALAGWIG